MRRSKDGLDPGQPRFRSFGEYAEHVSPKQEDYYKAYQKKINQVKMSGSARKQKDLLNLHGTVSPSLRGSMGSDDLKAA